MYRKYLKSKIHRAVATGVDLNYEGSITIDSHLLEKAGIDKYEFVQVVNISNGARFETYTINGQKGSGVVEVNGAAARLVYPGDQLIIMSEAYLEDASPEGWKPTIIFVNEKNQIKE